MTPCRARYASPEAAGHPAGGCGGGGKTMNSIRYSGNQEPGAAGWANAKPPQQWRDGGMGHWGGHKL